MKTILCFGDSNTWGQVPLNPFTKQRFAPDVRWTGILQKLSQGAWTVIEEGLNGRTTAIDDPIRAGRSGQAYWTACLDSHVPLDLVILMLGTNDLKEKYNPAPESITARVQALVQTTKRICSEPPHSRTQILVIAPPVIKAKFYVHGDFDYPESEVYSRALASHYARMCAEEEVAFLDITPHVESSEIDGCHLDEANHDIFANIVFERIKSLL